MNLLYLRYFYEVARAGSVTAGAKKVRISQPAISKMIRALEDELGARLFERLPRGVRLTPEGRLAFERASRIFAEATALRDELGQASPALRGPWCVGASDTLALHLLPGPVARLKSAHPGLRVSLLAGTSGLIKDEMLKDRCDLGLFFTPLKRGEPFEARVCMETEFWIVASPLLLGPKGSRARLGPRDLRRLPRLESRHSDYAAGFPAHFHSQALGLDQAPHLEVNSHEVKKRLALDGVGYAFLIRETVQREIERGELLRIPTSRPLRAPIYCVTRRGRAPGRASIELLSMLPMQAPLPTDR